jgi:hypothetical protein
MIDLVDTYENLPVYYIHDVIITIVGIHQRHKNHFVSALPKDILKLLINYIWKTRDSEEWTK